MLIRAEAADLRQASNDALCRARDARAAGMANRQVELEPTTGLEPVTCRLRIDPALRKLLCKGTCFGAFRGVFGHLGSHLYSSCTTEKRTIEEPIWRRHVARRTGRRHLAAGFCDLIFATPVGSQDDEWRARQFRAGWADFDSSMFPCSSRDAACGSGLDPEKRRSPVG